MVQDPSSEQSSGSSIWLMLIGIVLIIIAFFLIFWNEGVGLHGMKPVQLAGYPVTPVPNSPVNFNNNNKLIYTSGPLTTNSLLQDPLLGYSEKAIKIERRVEMYQWSQSEETKKQKLPDGSEQEVVTYVYKPVWSKELIDSNAFKDAVAHQNPVNMPLNALSGEAQDATLGDFHLDQSLVALIPGDVTVNLANVNVSNIQQGTKLPVQHDGDYIFIGANSKAPAIGDVRISIHKVVPQDVSVIALQDQNDLRPLKAEGSKPIAMLALGQVPLNDMVHQGKTENKNIAWLIRIVALLMMLIGAGLIINTLSAMPNTSPMIKQVVSFGLVLSSFLIGLGIWAISLAIAWFVVRPSWAVILIIIVLAIYAAVYAVVRRRGKQEQAG